MLIDRSFDYATSQELFMGLKMFCVLYLDTSIRLQHGTHGEDRIYGRLHTNGFYILSPSPPDSSIDIARVSRPFM